MNLTSTNHFYNNKLDELAKLKVKSSFFFLSQERSLEAVSKKKEKWVYSFFLMKTVSFLISLALSLFQVSV